ncbi:MAG: hypothetical protein WD885_02360 [Candidatus Saccharimonadales bacterium]
MNRINRSKLKIRLLTLGLGGLAVIAIGLELGNITSFTGNQTAQDNTKPHKEGSRQPISTEGEGGIINTSGTENIPSEDKGISSKSGNITVFRPSSNSLVKTGSIISGSSKTNSISYRLIDDAVGVIAGGSIPVIDGKFSGKFEFKSEGAKGRLDVFSTLDDGREVNIVEIPLRLK